MIHNSFVRHHALGIAALGICVVFTAMYYRCLFVTPAGDDWLLIQPVQELARQHGLWGAFIRVFGMAVGDFYRPVAWLPYLFAADSFVWLQLTKLLLAMALFGLVIRTSLDAGLARFPALLVGAASLFHQISVSVISELDLWGDLLAAISFMFLVLLAFRYSRYGMGHFSYVTWTLLTTTICLLSKEAGVVCFVVPLLFLMISPFPLDLSQRKGFAAATGGSLLLVIAYILVRSTLGIESTGGESGYYTLTFGTNIVKNAGLAIFALLSPISTVRVALDGFVWMALAGAWAIVLTVLAAVGMSRAISIGTWRLPLCLLAIAFLSQGPVLLMPHLTEANFVRTIPLGLLAVVLLWRQAIPFGQRNIQTGILSVFVVLWFCFDFWAVFEKSGNIVTSQLRAARFRA